MCGVRTREDPTQPKEPDPPLPTDREGGGGDWGESGWTGEKNRVVGREGCFEVAEGVGGW